MQYCVCSIHSKNCSEESRAPIKEVKSSSSKTDASAAGLSVQFMSPTASKMMTGGATESTRTSQRIANYTVASASASNSSTAINDKDARDIL